jgi:hypothetical protein
VESTIEIAGLKALIKKTMREVLQEERLLLCKILMPYVSDAEQVEIEAQFGAPDDTDEEWVDMTEWVKHGGTLPQTSI